MSLSPSDIKLVQSIHQMASHRPAPPPPPAPELTAPALAPPAERLDSAGGGGQLPTASGALLTLGTLAGVGAAIAFYLAKSSQSRLDFTHFHRQDLKPSTPARLDCINMSDEAVRGLQRALSWSGLPTGGNGDAALPGGVHDGLRKPHLSLVPRKLTLRAGLGASSALSALGGGGQNSSGGGADNKAFNDVGSGGSGGIGSGSGLAGVASKKALGPFLRDCRARALEAFAVGEPRAPCVAERLAVLLDGAEPDMFLSVEALVKRFAGHRMAIIHCAALTTDGTSTKGFSSVLSGQLAPNAVEALPALMSRASSNVSTREEILASLFAPTHETFLPPSVSLFHRRRRQVSNSLNASADHNSELVALGPLFEYLCCNGAFAVEDETPVEATLAQHVRCTPLPTRTFAEIRAMFFPDTAARDRLAASLFARNVPSAAQALFAPRTRTFLQLGAHLQAGHLRDAPINGLTSLLSRRAPSVLGISPKRLEMDASAALTCLTAVIGTPRFANKWQRQVFEREALAVWATQWDALSATWLRELAASPSDAALHHEAPHSGSFITEITTVPSSSPAALTRSQEILAAIGFHTHCAAPANPSAQWRVCARRAVHGVSFSAACGAFLDQIRLVVVAGVPVARCSLGLALNPALSGTSFLVAPKELCPETPHPYPSLRSALPEADHTRLLSALHSLGHNLPRGHPGLPVVVDDAPQTDTPTAIGAPPFPRELRRQHPMLRPRGLCPLRAAGDAADVPLHHEQRQEFSLQIVIPVLDSTVDYIGLSSTAVSAIAGALATAPGVAATVSGSTISPSREKGDDECVAVIITATTSIPVPSAALGLIEVLEVWGVATEAARVALGGTSAPLGSVDALAATGTETATSANSAASTPMRRHNAARAASALAYSRTSSCFSMISDGWDVVSPVKRTAPLPRIESIPTPSTSPDDDRGGFLPPDVAENGLARGAPAPVLPPFTTGLLMNVMAIEL